ncbi:MAG: helix-turn-helix domain-containing protein [Bacteroidota bacterium]
MLFFNFNRVFKARGIDKPFSYISSRGYSKGFATRIANSRIDKLNLKDIERLCEMLLCTPNDFIQWIPDSKDKDNENHPLYSLKRTTKIIELTQLLNSIPLDKLDSIHDLINKEITDSK